MTNEPVRPPRQRLSADERREQLAAATVSVVAAEGYQGATADAIAREAGLSKGLLWHYFTDREDLLEHTARRTLVVVRTAVATEIDLSAAVPQVVRAAVHRVVELRHTHAAELRTLREIVVILRHPDGSLRLGLADYEETYAGQEALFRRGQRDGDLRPGVDPRLVAVTYQGAVDSLLGYLDLHPDADGDACADAVADIVLQGIQQPVRDQLPSDPSVASTTPNPS